jgi:cell division protein ZapA
MKQIDVEIMGQSYRLSCPAGGEERLQKAVERVDTAMCTIRDGGKVRARDRIAVLAALNLAFDIADTQAANAESALPRPDPNIVLQQSDAATQTKLQALIHRLDAALKPQT